LSVFKKHSYIVFYHGYSRKSDLVATGSSLRHSGDQDVDSDISWTLGSQSVEVKHDHLCMPCVGPSGFFSLFLKGQTPLLVSGFLVASDATSHRQLKYSMT